MASPDETAREDEARALIVEKYRRGRDGGAQIDHWEDPSFSVYARTDYYGFIHENTISSVFLLAQDKIRNKDIKREVKWRKITGSDSAIAKLFHSGRASEKLTRRVFKGIPQVFRMKMWPILMSVEQAKKARSSSYYQEMLRLALAHSPHIRQIDLDVNRTFRDTTYFRERYGDRQKALFHVLAAYSMHNTDVGYCQGMSQLAGLMLIYLSEEEEAFWGIDQLMSARKYSMHGYFSPGFPRLTALFEHHEKVLARFLPKLGKHLSRQDFPTSLYALKWFMQCFLDRVPISLCMRLWDIYLLEGERVLIAMAYTILKMHQKRLLKMDQNQMAVFLQQELSRNFLYEDDTVIGALKDCLEELRKARLDMMPQAPSPPAQAKVTPTPRTEKTASVVEKVERVSHNYSNTADVHSRGNHVEQEAAAPQPIPTQHVIQPKPVEQPITTPVAKPTANNVSPPLMNGLISSPANKKQASIPTSVSAPVRLRPMSPPHAHHGHGTPQNRSASRRESPTKQPYQSSPERKGSLLNSPRGSMTFYDNVHRPEDYYGASSMLSGMSGLSSPRSAHPLWHHEPSPVVLNLGMETSL